MIENLFSINFKALVSQYATRGNVNWILNDSNVHTLAALVKTLLDEDKGKSRVLYNSLKKYFEEENKKYEDL